ncbi:MAG: hypothetical protein ACO1OG_03070 [Devosia sp.]
MRVLPCLVAALLATPAFAQTDDRVSNMALRLMAADSVVSEIGGLCITSTGSDPAVIAAFEGWNKRNHGWRIVGVSTLGTRGVFLPPDALRIAQEDLRRQFMPLYTAAENQADWCRQMASDIETGQMDAGLMFPEAATMVEESRSGKWPMLDVANSIEVERADEVRARLYEVEELMARCAATFGDPRELYADAFPYWRMRNVDVLMDAEAVLQSWGALAPEREAEAITAGTEAVEATFWVEDTARQRCEGFVSGLEDGAEDFATLRPTLLTLLRDAVANPPGPDAVVMPLDE